MNLTHHAKQIAHLRDVISTSDDARDVGIARDYLKFHEQELARPKNGKA